MTSKTRVSLLNKKTIPRLELLSNLTASRLVNSVSQPLETVVKVNVVNWTDSMIRNTEEEYLTELRVHHNCNSSNRKLAIKVGDVICVYKNKAPRQLCGMGVVRSLITGRDGYHRGAVVRVRSGDRVVEMTRPLNRLYPVEVESQVREERQSRNTDFPITFVGNAEQVHVGEH